MIGIVVGTRPEIIKMLPIIHECQKRNLDYKILNSMQSFDKNMNEAFLEEFEIEIPPHIYTDKYIRIPSRKFIGLNEFFKNHKFDMILVEGDTDTAFFTALYAKRNRIPVGHVEAGLRCGDLYMYEEQNRIFIDHIVDLNFAPTEIARKNLIDENIDITTICQTGNTIVESLEYLQKRCQVPVEHFLNSHILLTIHRRENLAKIYKILVMIEDYCDNHQTKAIFPCHPHTKKYVRQKDFKSIKIIEPIGYREFIETLLTCKLVITDSGGVQEESCILKVPCITIRKSTERPETLELNNILFDIDVDDDLLEKINEVMKRDMRYEQPYGAAGTISKKIVDVVEKFMEERSD